MEIWIPRGWAKEFPLPSVVLKAWSLAVFEMHPRKRSRVNWGQDVKGLNKTIQESQVGNL